MAEKKELLSYDVLQQKRAFIKGLWVLNPKPLFFAKLTDSEGRPTEYASQLEADQRAPEGVTGYAAYELHACYRNVQKDIRAHRKATRIVKKKFLRRMEAICTNHMTTLFYNMATKVTPELEFCADASGIGADTSETPGRHYRSRNVHQLFITIPRSFVHVTKPFTDKLDNLRGLTWLPLHAEHLGVDGETEFWKITKCELGKKVTMPDPVLSIAYVAIAQEYETKDYYFTMGKSLLNARQLMHKEQAIRLTKRLTSAY